MLVRQAEHEPPPPSTVCELPIPPELEDIVMRCLDKRPENRPQSADALIEALDRVTALDAWSPADASV